jgi:SNF2 family DNA or RNA helicase
MSNTGGGCALYLDMGLGKSLTAVAVTGRLFLDGHIKRVLVVAPSSVCPVWPAEYQKFAGFPHRVKLLLGTREKRLTALKQLVRPVITGAPEPLRVAVINYESTWRLEKELAGFAPDMIICDESQRIKSHTASQSKAMHRLGDAAKYKIVLTGTPMQQDVRDIWSQYRFLAPDIFGRNYYAFQNRFCVFGGYQNHQYLGPRNLDELTRKMHSIALRIRKEDCLDLPGKTFEERPVLLEDTAAKLYERIRKESFAELSSGGTVTPNIVLTKLLRLQQIAGGFLTDDDGQTHRVSTAKLDAAADIIETLCVDEGRKIVVFVRYTAEYEALVERAAEVLGPNLKLVGIRGGVASEQRGNIVAQFQNDPDARVFIGNLQACSEGISLTAADTVLYYSVGWSLGQYLQSADRIHRINQRNACTYIHLVAAGTVDENILGALRRKENLARAVVDNWRDLFK